jgi:hypothetical protein
MSMRYASSRPVLFLTRRGLVDQRAQLAIVVAAIALDVGGNLADRHRWILFRIRLDPEDVDRVPLAGAVAVADEDAVAGDAETPSVSGRFQIAVLPVAGRFVLDRGHGEHPVQMLHVPE